MSRVTKREGRFTQPGILSGYWQGNIYFTWYAGTATWGDTQPYADIPVNKWITQSDNVHIWYAAPGSLTGKCLHGLLEEVQPDIVYLNSMYSLAFTLRPLGVLLLKGYIGRIILAPRGMLHKGALARKHLKKTIFLKLFRLFGWHKKLIFHATDEQERRDIIYFFSGKAKVYVLENIPNTTSHPWTPKLKKPGTLNCVFISRIHPKKNVHYFLEVLSGIGGDSQLTFDIYGIEEDKHYLRECRELAEALGKNIQVGFKGPVPNHGVMDTLCKYHVFILPSLGENFGHAIYEALSAGDPVLISDQTPWRNLERQKTGWDIPLENRNRFSSVIRQALAWNQGEYDTWSQQAFQYAKSRSDTRGLAEKYKLLFG